MRRKLFVFFFLLLLVCVVRPLGYAQVDYSTATLTGTVFDPQHLLISGATVAITNPGTGFTKKVVTGTDGEYRFPLLTPGTYHIEAEAQGFAGAKGTFSVSVGQIAKYDFNLKLGPASATVEVSGELALVQVEQTQQANTINERQVNELPNLSRNYVDSVYTLPGVSNSESPRAQNPGFSGFQSSGFSIGGGNGRNNLVTVDGGENDYGSGQLRVPTVPVDSIQEFQVNRSSFAAEFGFTSGTAVNIVTKSGTNDFHGSAYAYFRNNSTDAANYFAPKTGKAYEQNFVPGFTFGGPIIKNKMFFFTSYEFTKTDTPQFRSYSTSAAAQGINSNPAQLNYVSQLAATGNRALLPVAGMLNFILTPSNFDNTAKLLDPNSGTFNDWKRYHNWVTRVDYQPTANDTITGRFSFMNNDYSRMFVLDPLNSWDDATLSYWRDYTLLGAWNHTFSSRLLNQLRIQVVPSDTADVPVVSPNTAYLTLGSLGNFQGEHYEPYYARQRRFQFEDTLTWTRGRHTLKFGTSYRPIDYHVEDHLWMRGEFNFFDGAVPLLSPVESAIELGKLPPAVLTALVGFNLRNGPKGPCSNSADCYMQMAMVNGVPTPVPNSSLTATNLSALQSFDVGVPVAFRQGFGNPVWDGWGHNFGASAQDSWKVSNTFTLDFGGRIDYSAEASPIPHHVYFSPRLGFAWNPGGDQKTVIRGGGGMFVAPIPFYNDYIMNLLGPSGKYINQVATILTPPGLARPEDLRVPQTWGYGIQTGKLPFGHLETADLEKLGFEIGPGQPGRVVVEPVENFQNVYSIQASLSVQRELVHNLSGEVAYQMYHGLHQQLPFDTNVQEIPCNKYSPGTPITPAYTSVIDPFVGPCYTQIDKSLAQLETYASIGSSIYHGMTASLTRRWSNGLQFQANYTFSKTIDDNTDFNNNFMPFRPTRLNLERALSSFNIKHNFVASAVYTTPFKPGGNAVSSILSDVALSPVLAMRSGIPFTIRVPGLDNGTLGQNMYARPWNAGRNTGIGPNFYSLNLRVTKSVYFRRDSGLGMQFLVEGTNILNHTNFSAVNDQFPADPNPIQAGPSTVNLLTGPYNLKGFKSSDPSQPLAFKSAFDARQLQFAIKFMF